MHLIQVECIKPRIHNIKTAVLVLLKFVAMGYLV